MPKTEIRSVAERISKQKKERKAGNRGKAAVAALNGDEFDGSTTEEAAECCSFPSVPGSAVEGPVAVWRR